MVDSGGRQRHVGKVGVWLLARRRLQSDIGGISKPAVEDLAVKL